MPETPSCRRRENKPRRLGHAGVHTSAFAEERDANIRWPAPLPCRADPCRPIEDRIVAPPVRPDLAVGATLITLLWPVKTAWEGRIAADGCVTVLCAQSVGIERGR